MSLNPGKPNLLSADDRCVIDGQRLPGLPVLFDGHNRPVSAPSNWLRHLAVSGKIAGSSLQQYAKTLRNFWEFLEANDVEWTDVTDRILRNWRNRDRFQRAVEKDTCNEKLSLIYRFYCWAQSERYVSDMIGPRDRKDGTHPQIIIKFQRRGTKRSPSILSLGPEQAITSDLLFRVQRKPPKHVPTAEEMDRVYVRLSSQANEDLVVRNALLLNWAELEGLRRTEILSLKCCDIPNWEKIFQLQDEEAVYPLRIVGKGGKTRIVPLTHEMLAITRDYIDGERRAVFDRNMKPDPGYIFISHRSGKKLCADYVTNLMSIAFKGSEVDATLHRARARFLSRIVEQALDEGIDKFGFNFSHDTVLLKASEVAGHSNPSTLRYYLNLHLKRRAKETDAGRVHSLREKEIVARRAFEHTNLRLRRLDMTKELVASLQGQDSDNIEQALAEFNRRLRATLPSRSGDNT